MICPQCNVKTRDRQVTTECPKCRYQLIFPPRDPSQINDYFLIKKLKKISSDGAYYFTLKQLYYYALGDKAYKNVRMIGIPAVFIGSFSIPLLFLFLPVGLIMLTISLSLLATTYFIYTIWKFPYDINHFEGTVVNKWQLFKGNIDKLISADDIKFNQSSFDDIQNYSFEALLITGDNETANFLIKNDFHFKNKTAVVSQNKYPKHLFPYVIEQIEKNPSIPIFLIHNADILHLDMKEKIKRNWFKNSNVKIFDLGLHAFHVLKKRKAIVLKRDNVTLPSANLLNLPKKEQNWYKSGYFTELGIIPPVKLLNLLEYGINMYKEKGDTHFEQIMPSLFIVGLGLKLNSISNKDGGFDVDFGDDFG